MESNGIQVLDVAGLNLLVGKMKDGTLVCGKANEVPASGKCHHTVGHSERSNRQAGERNRAGE